MAGKIVVDITNPIDFQTMQPAVEGSSGAEEIAKQQSVISRMVKAFNTTFTTPRTSGQVGGLLLDVFMAGDDREDKAVVIDRITSGGMRAIDTGPLVGARLVEAVGRLQIALQTQRNTYFVHALHTLD